VLGRNTGPFGKIAVRINTVKLSGALLSQSGGGD
jgi:hypothetical protein